MPDATVAGHVHAGLPEDHLAAVGEYAAWRSEVKPVVGARLGEQKAYH